MALNVVLVDDHKIMRDGIKAILGGSAEFQVMAEAGNGADLNGIEAATEISRHCPAVKIIILSMYDDEATVVGAMRAGARAFVLKKASGSDLVSALHVVAKGGCYLSPQISDCLLRYVQRGDFESRPLPSALDALAPREIQVLRLVAEGNTSKEIATLLNLALETVRSYRKSMMKKLDVNNVASLTQVALAWGITHFLVPQFWRVGLVNQQTSR